MIKLIGTIEVPIVAVPRLTVEKIGYNNSENGASYSTNVSDYFWRVAKIPVLYSH